MKLEFIYSEVYFRNLNKYKNVSRNWEQVKELGKRFESKYQSKINQIVRIIPEITGKPWRRKITEVYLIDWDGPSFSHPLTLKVRDNLLLMLVILTHELLHDFYRNEKDIENAEKRINEDVKSVFEKLELDTEKQLEVLCRFHKDKFSKK